MPNHSKASSKIGNLCVHGVRTLLFIVGPLFLGAAYGASAQSIPEEAYGPYNVVILPDGSGLTKPLAPPAAIDQRTAGFLDRIGVHAPEQPEPLVEGRARWTVSFWFRSAD